MTTTRKRRQPYAGILAKPMMPPRPPKRITHTILDRPDTSELERQKQERIRALFEHYGVTQADTKEAWKALALALAEDKVPGLRVAKSRGGPVKNRTDAVTVYLWITEQLLKWSREGQARPVKEAARAIHKKYPGDYQHLTIQRLQNLYSEGKKRHRNLVREKRRLVQVHRSSRYDALFGTVRRGTFLAGRRKEPR